MNRQISAVYEGLWALKWEKDKNVRAGFVTKSDYIAFKKAEKRGAARRFKGKVQSA